ncbi:Carbohydrate-binding-like fold [Abeliophyllum distichum]|uniref:Carbohydrate-binding-like fold n=1 Tax=Abeliophyllum distichum TaxID=126358 RepID=A0ABD1P814_9LAMI
MYCPPTFNLYIASMLIPSREIVVAAASQAKFSATSPVPTIIGSTLNNSGADNTSMPLTKAKDLGCLSDGLKVTGFSVGGHVIDGNGDGVDAAQIVVDDHERSKTDKEGYYKLDQVLPNMASISDIKAVSYDICGRQLVMTTGLRYRNYLNAVHDPLILASVNCRSPGVLSFSELQVALTHGLENVKPQVKQTDKIGKFCFEVPPGEYRLSAFPATPDTAPELLFSPPHIDVMVNSPLLGVKFYQAQVDIHGSVVCKEKCGSSVSVKLLGLDGFCNVRNLRKVSYPMD